MKTILKLLGTAMVLLALTATSFAQVTAYSDAEAHIITPLTIENEVILDFGNIAVIDIPGTVELTPSNPASRTGGGGATPVANPTGVVTAAEFSINGGENFEVFITLPADGVVTVELNSDPLIHMHVNDFTSDPDGSFIMGSTTQTLYVGATLYTDGDQTPGKYNALTDFPVTVNYQ